MELCPLGNGNSSMGPGAAYTRGHRPLDCRIIRAMYLLAQQIGSFCLVSTIIDGVGRDTKQSEGVAMLPTALCVFLWDGVGVPGLLFRSVGPRSGGPIRK